MTRILETVRGPLGLAAAALLASAAPGAAQPASSAEARWQAWIGCWAPVSDQGTSTANPAAQVLCVVPAGSGSSIELTTITDGKVVERERVDADGVRRDVQKDGCKGFETASFSGDSRRIYLHSDYMCTGDVHRSSTGLIAMTAENEWIDIQTVNVGDARALRVTRYRSVEPAAVPAGIAGLVGPETMATSTIRIAASAPLTMQEIFDVSSHVDAAALEALVLERRPTFPLDAASLTELGDAGLPVAVIDLLIALAYPDRFEVTLSERGGALRPAQHIVPVQTGNSYPASYDPFQWDRYRSFGYGRYYYSPFGYSRLDGLYPNGYGIGYGNGYGGSRPLIIVVSQSELSRSRPQLVRGQGYTRTRSSRPSVSRGSTSGNSTSSGKTSKGKTSTGSSSTGGTSTGSASGSTGRQAKPRNAPPPSP
jgi:hypothetical protein